jgi:CheY-like chemotaxis protein
MDLRCATSEFVTQGRDLLKRLRSIEGDTLTGIDLHVLRTQLYLLEGEVSNRQHLLTSRQENIGNKIRVLLVDDHPVVRQALHRILQPYSNIEVIGESCHGDDAVMSIGKFHPAIVVMDINMQRMDGVTAAQLIKAQYPHVLVLGFSAEAKDYNLYTMQQAGAMEVLNKDNATNDFYAGIQRAVAAIESVGRCPEHSNRG